MSDVITWVDVETTGVDAQKDALLEVACLVTDWDLNILDETGYRAVVKYRPLEVSRMKLTAVPFVLEMHRKTGLWDQLEHGKSLAQVDRELFAYIKNFAPDGGTRLGGNSIVLDRNFINANLPQVANHLHYRSIDVSSVSELAINWYGDEAKYEKKTLHEAFSDIQESIAQLQFLRKNFFKDAN